MASNIDDEFKATIAQCCRNTRLGFLRIRRNLQVEDYTDSDTEEYLREIITTTHLENIEKRGKNYYFKCLKYNAVLTINASSLTVITAKEINKHKS